MSAIAQYRLDILALLTDPTNAIFSSASVDQSLLWALNEYSKARPLIRTYDFTVIGATAKHTLPADFVTREITRVELWNTNPDLIIDLSYYAYWRDEQWVVETTYQRASGDVLQISYSANHQIDGLASAAGTTVPDADETMLVGASGRCAQMRGIDRVETINMNADVITQYHAMGDILVGRFLNWLRPDPGVRVAEMDYPEITF